ncbi:serine beta-lactamase-like superfamily protein [Grosmannia clavigera kw1407]|uniref:Nuclear transport factor 2 n=1 Tax=Grosmannia clavigera (strain kw1407 / UAMH 11150) TaxID=655863 RepID=F0XDI3_GROCL|nr:serine beta-lactamase-like superfamily protein [Grosmannia clavigera kw1407]EFX04400.1 serine beta-lactamase-like superfamily protein [Grosmannia clavigera kw1407]
MRLKLASRTAQLVLAVPVLGAIALAPSQQQQQQQQRLSDEADGIGSGSGHSPFDAAFGALAAKTLAAWRVPGIAAAVLDGDATWTAGFGRAQLPDEPVTADTLFYTASTTKAFVAATLGLLIDSGQYTAGEETPLAWSTPLSAILRDDFVVADDDWATAHLTIDDALAHRSGLAGHDLTRSRRYGLDGVYPAGVREVTRSLRHLPLTTSPRTEYRYCNLMFLVLSHAVETLAGGRWLGHILHDRLWAPLGMRSTFLSLDHARAAPAPASLAQGYYWDEAATVYVPVPHMPLHEVSGAGGIISTVADYARWLRCWIDGPAASRSSPANVSNVCGGIPLTGASFDHILTPKIFTTQTAASAEPFDAPVAYASAWTTSSYRGHRFWGHSGGSNAFGAQVYFFPDDRFGVVLFGNTAITSNAAELVLLWHLVDEHFGIPPAERYDWSAKLRSKAATRAARFDTALDRLYPQRAQPPLPPSLPLADFVGTYYHPAYQNLTLQLMKSNYSDYGVVFTAERREHTWPTLCEFVHVSGDSWAMYTDMLYERSGNFRGYGRARFQVGADGRAGSLVVEFWDRDDDTVEGVFTFVRIDDMEWHIYCRVSGHRLFQAKSRPVETPPGFLLLSSLLASRFSSSVSPHPLATTTPTSDTLFTPAHETTLSDKMADFQTVADQFVSFYYQTFDGNRKQLQALYRDQSMLTFESASVLGAAAIVEKLGNLPFEKVTHQVSTKDAQPTMDGGLLVLVTGHLLIDEEQRPMGFSQAFQLLKDASGYFVYNDIFKLIYG